MADDGAHEKSECATCPYYYHEQANLGQCRRRPPRVVPVGGDVTDTLWPDVYPTEWCGDHPRLAPAVARTIPVADDWGL